MNHPLIMLSSIMAILGIAISVLMIPTIRISTEAKYRDQVKKHIRDGVTGMKTRLKKMLGDAAFWEVLIAVTTSTAIITIAYLAA